MENDDEVLCVSCGKTTWFQKIEYFICVRCKQYKVRVVDVET